MVFSELLMKGCIRRRIRLSRFQTKRLAKSIAESNLSFLPQDGKAAITHIAIDTNFA